MFKPHVTVACIVQAEGKFLVVEETIRGKVTWNQPAGHLEANETLIAAAKRELWEETGIHAEPQTMRLDLARLQLAHNRFLPCVFPAG